MMGNIRPRMMAEYNRDSWNFNKKEISFLGKGAYFICRNVSRNGRYLDRPFICCGFCQGECVLFDTGRGYSLRLVKEY